MLNFYNKKKVFSPQHISKAHFYQSAELNVGHQADIIAILKTLTDKAYVKK